MALLRAVFGIGALCCSLLSMQGWAAMEGTWATNFSAPVIGPGGVLYMAAHGNKVVAAGEFNTAGSVASTNCAVWNGSNWVALPGYSFYIVRGVAVWQNKYYVVNWDWTRGVDVLVEWNGQGWTELLSRRFLTESVVANDRGVYLAGVSTNISEFQWAGTVWHWDGTNWTINPRYFLGTIYGAFASGNDLYVASRVPEITQTGTQISRWDGTNWFDYPVLPGLAYRSLLTMFNGQLHVGTRLGEGPLEIVRWDGQWTTLSSLDFHDGGLLAMTGTTNGLYVGGIFEPSTSTYGANVACWNGTKWTFLPWDSGDFPMAMAWAGNRLHVGGWSNRLRNTAKRGVARWNGSNWEGLQDGVRTAGRVYALAGSAKNLFVGGSFDGFHGIAATNLARWNGTEWKAFGSPNGDVNALCTSTAQVFVAGDFTRIGGIGATNVARWNGTNWSALGIGPGFRIRTLTSWRGEVYAGGSTYRPGVQPVSRWTGTRWQPVRGSTNDLQIDLVLRFADTAHGLYVFDRGSDQGFSRWDGKNWSVVAGSPRHPWSIGSDGYNVWVAAYFEDYGDALGRWDGTNWWLSSLVNFQGGPSTGGITTLNGDVYWAQYGTNYVWNGLDWDSVDVSGPIYDVCTFNGSVYFGGFIRTAGGKPSHALAAWQPAAARPELIARRTADGLLVAWPSALTNYVLQSAGEIGQWSNAASPVVTFGSRRITTNSVGESDRRFFRLRRQP